MVEISATPTTRSPNSSGCCSASAMIVMPPIEWPTSTTGPSGTTSSRTCLRSWPSWSMVAWPVRRAAGAAVRALVVEDRPDQAAVAGALEVPAVEVERVAVARRPRSASAAPRSVRRRPPPSAAYSSTSTCSGTPSSATTVIGVERSEPNGVGVAGAAARDDAAAPGDPDARCRRPRRRPRRRRPPRILRR